MRSISTAFLLFVSGLMVVGFFVGSSMSDSDWLSPITNTAKARQIEAQTQLDIRRADLELDHFEKSLARKLEAEKANQAQWRALREVGFIVALGVGSGALLALTAALSYFLVCRGQLALAARARYGRAARPRLSLVQPRSRRGEKSQGGRPARTADIPDQAA